jgi:hypothetical protein
MFLSHLRSQLPVVIAAAAILSFACAAGATNVTYTATGTFSSPAVNGTDLFKLAGQPFTISVVASESAVPVKKGGKWAVYNKLKMTGTVQSGLVPTPIAISTNAATIELAYGNPSYNVFALFAPVKVLSLQINITAVLKAPPGTITSAGIAPFSAPVALSAANSSVAYATTTSGSTGLTVASGSLSTTTSAQTTAKAAAAQAPAVYAGGAALLVSKRRASAAMI